MSSERAALAREILNELGTDNWRYFRPGMGWPSTVELRVAGRWQPTDMYVSRVSTHSRRDYERRFQNPQQNMPIVVRPGHYPLLIGLSEEPERLVCVGADAERRANLRTRFSVLFPVDLMHEAARVGWAEWESSADELMVSFHPALLPAYLQVRRGPKGLLIGEIANALANAGTIDREDPDSRERARAVVSRIVVSRQFREDVVHAYAGACALCGLDWGLVQAAHIYPASAPGCIDEVTNGIAMCGNHHLLFDGHRLYIDPESKEVSLHPDLYAAGTAISRSFLHSTYDSLQLPASEELRPSAEMLARRYGWFEHRYHWCLRGGL